MKKWTIIFGVALFALSTTTVHAQSQGDTFTNRSGMYAEFGARSDPDAIGGEFGLSRYISEHLSLRGGLAFLASDSFNDIFAGGTFGARYSLGKRISPFIGLGIFAGDSEETVPAEDDNIDNDEDGFIDESGEKKEIVDDVIASIYPELGLHLWVTETTRLTFASKYHITTKGRDHDFWLFTFGFAILFD